MALVGLSLILASVVYVIIRPPHWLSHRLLQWRGFQALIADGPLRQRDSSDGSGSQVDQPGAKLGKDAVQGNDTVELEETISDPDEQSTLRASTFVPEFQTPIIAESEEETTPKAEAAKPAALVPSFSLSDDSTAANLVTSDIMPPPPKPPSSSLMPPPSAPVRRPPGLAAFPARDSPQRAKGPAPNRGTPAGAGLAPPPTHSAKPAKPSRKVMLEPGHSPLDWARISGPNADLRNLPPQTPYLRVTPSMLKAQSGRRGKDAWMALNGKVYNVSPYADFHPAGRGELMRGAGKDGTKLFGEVHPWVNYETMLAACLVGLLVDEPDAQGGEMDIMD